MTKHSKGFLAETPANKNKISTDLLDLPSEILIEILKNLSIDELNKGSLVNRKLNHVINGSPDGEDQHLPSLEGYSIVLRHFEPVFTPQLMTRKEYLFKLSQYRRAQHKEIEYIQQYWDWYNWRHISSEIKKNFESIEAQANTLEEFQQREQWLNDINEVAIRAVIDVNKKTLYLSEKKLTRFPASLFRDESLEIYWEELNFLNLSLNQLTKLPAELGNLVALEKLCVTQNQLTELPAELGKLVVLKELYLGCNQLTKLPAELGKLVALEKIYLMDNKLTELPAELGKLVVLKELYLGCNKLTKLPAELGKLVALEKIHLMNNKLTELPAELGKLVVLEILELYNNELAELPAELGNLVALRYLSLDHNQFTELPAWLGNFIALEELGLEHNQLNQLPPELSKLVRLQHLCLDHNQLPVEQLVIFKQIKSEVWLRNTLGTQILEHRALPRP